ncbi:uncharacterized protein OCT59_019555 [Rhizophagus irregularis]|uniref:Uncharacterized protein n=2 Tax=Rhizophagus irregularis TaxID=588596 RepID=A0A2N1N680_9GLOM|nr:hypothetical protein GLOIN_2v1503729 [Rhizophagus irregularis DAOM 181602=DAOM 197198]PKK69371.1 hypothetical protein RhiirC2_748575 [Rhizophagus irregularis]POG81934.1 hypothetical protein GLOIN_2v1503729 [Rhizophagus irregularis DAOM 181602=DAOM 197198]UZO27357.1 hypothetical protein OCT59_019555 [Rhizophagus irregularis]CAB4396633.1 unnamed protein product [Rhizophagus irregularis]CAB4483788.1 unnamed protein product [Rhizophagus irregularis]|eukprot:XP_025188800.1 hypothetical protein GLOIN_2v1503729 [Rhizophagus irregularis DAOM 181602=DAOM 197198]
MNFLVINSNALPFSDNKKFPIIDVIGTITEMPNIDFPKNITIPDHHKFDFLLSAYGVQIYKCFVNNHIPNNWTLVTPDAFCINDKHTQTFTPEFEVVHHYFLPKLINGGRIVWKSIIKNDNSLIVAKVIAQNTSPDGPSNLPWLVSQVTHHEGEGRYSEVTYVLRVNTQGGVAPAAEQCGTFYPDGAIVKIPYNTDYFFIK